MAEVSDVVAGGPVVLKWYPYKDLRQMFYLPVVGDAIAARVPGEESEGDRLARFFSTSAVEEHESAARRERAAERVTKACDHDEFGPFGDNEGRVAAMISCLADGFEVVLDAGISSGPDLQALRARCGRGLLSVRYQDDDSRPDSFIVKLDIPRGM